MTRPLPLFVQFFLVLYTFAPQIHAQNTSSAPPSAPFNLTATLEDGRVLLTWGFGIDSETAQERLTYDLRVGTESGASDIIAPNGSSAGNMGTAREYDLGSGVTGPIYWSVASVDEQFERSEFAGEQVFDLQDDEFRDINASSLSFGVWGDYDNDGDLDLFTSEEIPLGTTNTFKVVIFQNNNGSFSEIQTDMPAGMSSLQTMIMTMTWTCSSIQTWVMDRTGKMR